MVPNLDLIAGEQSVLQQPRRKVSPLSTFILALGVVYALNAGYHLYRVVEVQREIAVEKNRILEQAMGLLHQLDRPGTKDSFNFMKVSEQFNNGLEPIRHNHLVPLQTERDEQLQRALNPFYAWKKL